MQAALRETGCRLSVCWISARCDETPEYWRAFNTTLDEWIGTWRQPIAISVFSDMTCRYLAYACARNGIRVPEDAALIGVGNEPSICEGPAPGLTSIDLDYQQVGRTAVSLLEGLMEGSPPPAEPVIVPPAGLVLRLSTDIYAVDDLLVSQAMRFIAEHTHEAITVGDVVAHLPTSRRSLERRFRRRMGRTVAAEIMRLRLERAKRLLGQTDQAIKIMASECGFSSAREMWRAFRKQEGISPAEYRSRRRKGRAEETGKSR